MESKSITDEQLDSIGLYCDKLMDFNSNS
jgi:hypothetical protein